MYYLYNTLEKKSKNNNDNKNKNTNTKWEHKSTNKNNIKKRSWEKDGQEQAKLIMSSPLSSLSSSLPTLIMADSNHQNTNSDEDSSSSSSSSSSCFIDVPKQEQERKQQGTIFDKAMPLPDPSDLDSDDEQEWQQHGPMFDKAMPLPDPLDLDSDDEQEWQQQGPILDKAMPLPDPLDLDSDDDDCCNSCSSNSRNYDENSTMNNTDGINGQLDSSIHIGWIIIIPTTKVNNNIMSSSSNLCRTKNSFYPSKQLFQKPFPLPDPFNLDNDNDDHTNDDKDHKNHSDNKMMKKKMMMVKKKKKDTCFNYPHPPCNNPYLGRTVLIPKK